MINSENSTSHFEIQSGNELLIQGGLEAGINLYTGYPGSPLADFFNILYEKKDQFQKMGIKVVIANSEANAAAMASGAKMAGQNTLIAMKSMGLHVASDALSVGNFANPGPIFIDPITQEKKCAGVVVAVGDDPWSISTSTPADSRFLFKHLHIPFLEPATPQELKDWLKVALEISQKSSLYCGILLTTWMAEGGGRVKCGEIKNLNAQNLQLYPEQFDLAKNVMVPPNTLKADKEMAEKRFPLVTQTLIAMNLDQILGNPKSELAFISSGAIFETLKQVLQEAKVLDQVCLYKLASSYPLCEELILPIAKTWKHLIVVEEKRGFLENELKTFFSTHQKNIIIWGKEFADKPGLPSYGGLNYEIIENCLKELAPHFKELGQLHLKNKTATNFPLCLPDRLPTFCPGCPHRETLSLMKELRVILEKKGVKLLSHGDVGCYSLSFLPPFKEMHDLSAMGQGGALAAGCDIFVDNPSVVLMGDSTFFHSGVSAISNSVQMGHNITYIILDNDNTAMTGHQMTPRTGISVEGKIRPRQDIEKIVEALGVSRTVMVNPSDRYYYKNLLEEVVESSGTKVIISNKECALTYQARLKAQERAEFKKGIFQPKKIFYQINTDACEHCLECVEATGCPGLSLTQDAYGPKVTIDHQICVNDSYCTKIMACPSFEKVEVTNYHPTLYQKREETKLNNLKILPAPQLKRTLDDLAQGLELRIVVIGVGGSGVTTISRVLAEAANGLGEDSKIQFKFVDQKGLAQRNGSVTSHLVFFPKDKSHGQVCPSSMAHLVLSPDLLEGTRALKYLAPNGSLILDQSFQVPLSLMLERSLEKDPINEELITGQLQNILQDRLKINSFKDLSYVYFGKAVYASAMILGVAFQCGELPFRQDDMTQAFRRTIPPHELENNLLAFWLGREWIASGESSTLSKLSIQLSQQNKIGLETYSLSLKKSLPFWKNTSVLMDKFLNHLKIFNQLALEIDPSYRLQYLHDIYVYNYGVEVDHYLEQIRLLKEKIAPTLFSLAVSILTKTFFIKDEVFVAHQLISPIKNLRDEKEYKFLGNSYQVFHINRPEFQVGSKQFKFHINARTWMLKIMSHFRFLRTFMPQWHMKEKLINLRIREELLMGPSEKRLRELNCVKGYREVRYKAFEQFFSKENIHDFR